jgi:exodeoxyribonuclease V alpha subunit
VRITVDSIVSEKPYGIIFAGTVGSGQQLRVRASLDRLLGIPTAGDTWEIEGDIRQTSFGPQIAVTAGRRLLSSGHLIRQFLASHVPGVGQLRAGRLWKEFGENLGEMLSTDDMLAEIGAIMSPEKPVLGQRLAVLVTSAWKAAKGEADLVTWLDRQGVRDIAVVRRLQRVLGDTAAQVLAANPYVMVPLLSWKRIDELGRRLLREDGRDPATDARRHVGAADEAVKQMLRRGDTASSVATFTVDVASLLDVDQRQTDPVLAAAIANAAVLVDQNLMRAPGAAGLEDDLTSRLAALACRPLEARLSAMPPSRWAELLADLTGPHKPLGDEQRAAAVAMMSRPLACMVGGGGTGKTYTCKVVCDLWTHLGGDVLLCALAGKAALRLSRSTGRLAKTLARTLAELKERQEIEERLADPETSGDEADKDRRKLEGLSQITDSTLVVIDEASMVDLPAVHAIARRLLPGSRLLLVGNPAQLPPIGFGIVFHKLVLDPSITLPLTQVHRQAAATGIPAAAAVVRAGDMPDFSTFTGAGTGVSFVDCRPDEIAQAMDGVVARLGDPAGLLVVTATIAGAAGVEETNARFHRRHVDAGHPDMNGFFGRSFSVGEPVIFGKNDYRAGLFNGLMGRVTAIDPGNREIAVVFDGDALPKTLGAEHLVDLDLAYAVSCHKCQGSSARRVVVPVYQSRVVDRSWLYTAITRAEQQVVFVGDRAAFATAVAKPPAADTRTTGFTWPAPFQAPAGTRSIA